MQRHPYIFASIFAAILAVVVWCCAPKKYSATIKISDEYKETDLAIGINSLTSKIKKELGSDNTGMNDIEVYCKILKTKDFARSISLMQVPGKHMSCGEWQMLNRHFWQTNDTIEVVSDNIEYNYSGRQQTITIQFSDVDALVSAQMLDSITNKLQDVITLSRHLESNALINDLQKKVKADSVNYSAAKSRYADYCDSHRHLTRIKELQEQTTLKNSMELAHNKYVDDSEQYTRQLALSQRTYSSFAVIDSNFVPVNDNSHFFSYIIPFVVIALVVTCLCRKIHDKTFEFRRFEFGGLFSPWTITLLVWVGIFVALVSSGNLMNPLSEQFKISIAIWLGIFLPVSIITYNLTERREPCEFSINMLFFNFLYVVAMIITPLYLYQIYKLISMFDTKDLMSNVRSLAVYGEGYGFLNYTFVVNEVLLLVALWLYPKIQWWKLATIIIACLLYAIGNMEKITLFLVVLSSIYVLYERKVISIRVIFVTAVVGLLSFYMFNLARSGEDSNYSKNESLLDFIGMYVMSGPVAFGHLSKTISSQFGSDTLWGIYLYLSKYLTGNFVPHQPFQDFVFVPMSTNVYTILRPYYTDFGYTGVAFFALIYGVSLGYIYRKMKDNIPFFVALYTYFIYVMILQFFDEFITSSLPLFGQMLLLLLILTQNKIRFSYHV